MINGRSDNLEHKKKQKYLCYCDDFSSQTGKMQLIMCKKCGRLWFGSGDLDRSNYTPLKVRLDISVMKQKFPEEFSGEEDNFSCNHS